MCMQFEMQKLITTSGSPPPLPPPPPPPPCRALAALQLLFCGLDMHFGFAFTKEALQRDEGIEVGVQVDTLLQLPAVQVSPQVWRLAPADAQVVQCDREQLQLEIADADVVVPLMCRLDDAVGAQVSISRLCCQLHAPMRTSPAPPALPLPRLPAPPPPLTLQTLSLARRLKLVIQFGVGVEAVDIGAATQLGVWVSNIQSGATGNALSCAEHAVYLMLAVLRSHNAMADRWSREGNTQRFQLSRAAS